MKYVNLGSTGLRVSRVCLGMMSYGNDSDRPWVLDEDAAEPIVKAAADGGVTFFDTADAYSGGASEVATGRLLAKMFTRDDVVVATKVFMPMGPGENTGGREDAQHCGANGGDDQRSHRLQRDMRLRRDQVRRIGDQFAAAAE